MGPNGPIGIPNIISSLTSSTDVQFTEVHVIRDGKLHNDVSGGRQVRVRALQVDRGACRHGSRILTTHGVAIQNGRLFLCGDVRQSNNKIVRTKPCRNKID